MPRGGTTPGVERVTPTPARARPVVDVLVQLDAPPESTEAVARPDALARLLDERFPAARWAVRVEPAPRSAEQRQRVSEAMGEARRALLGAGVDLVVLVTDRRLFLHGRQVRAHTSPVQRCAVLSLGEGRGASSVGRGDLGAEVVSLIGELLDLSGDARDAPVVASLADDGLGHPTGDQQAVDPARPRRSPFAETRQLLGQVAASRPWLMTLHLSRSLVGASAAAFLAIVTPDFWMLADRLSVARLVLISVLVVLSGVAVLVIGGGLRERPGPERSRRSVRQHNAAVWLGVGLGVLTLFAVLVLASLAITLVVLPGSLVAGAIGHPAGWATMTRIGIVTAIVSLVGSVFGAGLEDDEDVQEATFTGSDDVRFAEDEPAPATPAPRQGD